MISPSHTRGDTRNALATQQQHAHPAPRKYDGPTDAQHEERPLLTSSLTTHTHTRARARAQDVRGLIGMWRGVMPMVLSLPLNNALLMYGYGCGKHVASQSEEEGLLWPIFVGGCVGGALQSSQAETKKRGRGGFHGPKTHRHFTRNVGSMVNTAAGLR